MDINQTKKLSQDKIEADFLTKIVRPNIKRKEREKQDAREAFREAFEVLLESQGKSTKTQDLRTAWKLKFRGRFWTFYI